MKSDLRQAVDACASLCSPDSNDFRQHVKLHQGIMSPKQAHIMPNQTQHAI
jgi:hypothetical protein